MSYLITVRYTLYPNLIQICLCLTTNFFIWLLLVDEGDKLYILISGEVRIDLPDPDIDPVAFKQRYDEY